MRMTNHKHRTIWAEIGNMLTNPRYMEFVIIHSIDPATTSVAIHNKDNAVLKSMLRHIARTNDTNINQAEVDEIAEFYKKDFGENSHYKEFFRDISELVASYWVYQYMLYNETEEPDSWKKFKDSACDLMMKASISALSIAETKIEM